MKTPNLGTWVILVGGLCLGLLPPVSLAALEGTLNLNAGNESVWVVQNPANPPIQSDFQRLLIQGTLGDRWKLTDNLGAAGTLWVLGDTLPSQSPLGVPQKKTELASRVLEARVNWEPVQGTWMVDAGKKLASISSGFSHKPLDFFRRQTATASDGSAGSKWEEGWVGAEGTWMGEGLSVSDFFVPRLSWDGNTDQALRYLSLPQDLWQNQVKVSLRLGEADLRLLGLVSTPDGQGTWVFKTGAGLDTNVGTQWTLRAEGSAASSADRLRVTDAAQMQTKTETLTWAPQALGGVTWTGENDFSIMAEYYYNGLGETGAGYERLVSYTRNLRKGMTGTDLMAANGLLENACHYLFVRLSGKVEDKLTSDVWAQMNLQDFSTLWGAALHWNRDKWDLSLNLLDTWGRPDSEMGATPLAWKISAELNLYL